MTENWNENNRQVASLTELVATWGGTEDVDTLNELLAAAGLDVASGTPGSSRVDQLENDLANAEDSLRKWRKRYRDDVLKLSNERNAALRAQAEAERDAAAAHRELASRPETVNEDGELTREERQFTAQLRCLIDNRLGKRTPRRIQEIADGIFPEDRVEEDEDGQYHRRSRRSRRRGRHARVDDDQ